MTQITISTTDDEERQIAVTGVDLSKIDLDYLQQRTNLEINSFDIDAA